MSKQAMKKLVKKSAQKQVGKPGKVKNPKIPKVKNTTVKKATVKIAKGTLRMALVAGMKGRSGRKDLDFTVQSNVANQVMSGVPIEQRAGYPVNLEEGSVHPRDWRAFNGDPIEVDFGRVSWLPDNWGQGVKTTRPISRSKGGKGGTLTMFVAPCGKRSFFHKTKVEDYVGRKLSSDDGFKGQVRLAKLQAQQAIQLAKSEMQELCKSGSSKAAGVDPDEEFFKILSKEERKCLPKKDEFHFCVVSARRATKIEGVKDIFTVQAQLREAGVTPTWYVDADSLQDYKELGLQAVVGGKLTPARNKALEDARKNGKICVQMSDDISAWEYRHGAKASSRNDDELNAAYAAARRYIMSPLAAARFIVAKMRAAPEQPKLGGVYMLGSCARTFAGDEVSMKHFILGDFFVVDTGSSVTFDEKMTLKEDYDFSCAHLKRHQSVCRLNRMTLSVKHYSNSGGAVSTRDKKGKEEQKNINILQKKWPGVFSMNPKRENEVIMRWKGCLEDDDHDAEETEGPRAAKKGAGSSSRVRKAILKKVLGGA